MSKFLIVVDMQNDFIDGALGTKEAVAIVPYVKEKIENFAESIMIMNADKATNPIIAERNVFAITKYSSSPINIKIAPPRIPDFPANFVLAFFPRRSPLRHIIKVTIPIIKHP